MEITCSNCRKKIHLPEDKIPEGKSFAFRCPACRTRITVDPPPDAGGRQEKPAVQEASADLRNDFPVSGEDYDASEKPFDFLEEEGKTAMVLENDPERAGHIRSTLGRMDYHVTEPASVRDALRQMKYHQFDLIVLDETFDNSSPDANGVLIYLQRMTMDIRRNLFAALLTERFETMDNMAAFLKSVNVVIHKKDLGSLDRILARAINENELFYAVFKESLRKMGRY